MQASSTPISSIAGFDPNTFDQFDKAPDSLSKQEQENYEKFLQNEELMEVNNEFSIDEKGYVKALKRMLKHRHLKSSLTRPIYGAQRQARYKKYAIACGEASTFFYDHILGVSDNIVGVHYDPLLAFQSRLYIADERLYNMRVTLTNHPSSPSIELQKRYWQDMRGVKQSLHDYCFVIRDGKQVIVRELLCCAIEMIDNHFYKVAETMADNFCDPIPIK